jgi:hypothetical protein
MWCTLFLVSRELARRRVTMSQVATTIANQIKASGFLTMAEFGVTKMVAGEDCLILHCLKGLRAMITLTPTDTYTVQVGRLVKWDWKVRYEARDVYAENLVEVLRDGLLGRAA